jgi:hypothetical protein
MLEENIEEDRSTKKMDRGQLKQAEKSTNQMLWSTSWKRRKIGW